jgi:hypothetical protein
MKGQAPLRGLDDIDSPDQWDEIVRTRPEYPTPSTDLGAFRRAGIIVVAFGVALGGFILIGLAFGRPDLHQGATSSTSSSGGTPAISYELPSDAAVSNGRFVAPVNLDEGQFRVDVPSADLSPSTPQAKSTETIWASPTVSGVWSHSILGFGVVSSDTASAQLGSSISSVPAWIGIAWDGTVNCPIHLGSFDANSLPSSGYSAVVLPTDPNIPAFSYVSESSICGQPPTGPRASLGEEVVSIEWKAIDLSGTRLRIEYTPPPCASDAKLVSGGSAAAEMVTVDVTVPLNADVSACQTPTQESRTLDLGPAAQPSSTSSIDHGPLGPARQIQS